MTGMAVLLLVRPIVRHRDRFAQSDERGDGWSADGGHLDRAREHRGSNARFLLGHHLGSGRPRQSDGSVAAVRHDDVAGDVSFGTPLAPKARQRTTASHEYRRTPCQVIDGMRARKSGSQLTPRWREQDSNPRSPGYGGAR